ncbi:hypothetical protein PA598K_02670 [Paenibacillus sp. 598K]|uniref:RCC1 domain-containing protein n=1 Tax=Paenibacillus sp. 598K TaxID=1117987 RepID=UPI000FF9DF0A|nr:hypothetical protein [Paenibacillus sp. 598K]GBF74332.1 hypothetical protein PA598K_02670 [Paenibacillus sp. 598K]
MKKFAVFFFLISCFFSYTIYTVINTDEVDSLQNSKIKENAPQTSLSLLSANPNNVQTVTSTLLEGFNTNMTIHSLPNLNTSQIKEISFKAEYWERPGRNWEPVHSTFQVYLALSDVEDNDCSYGDGCNISMPPSLAEGILIGNTSFVPITADGSSLTLSGQQLLTLVGERDFFGGIFYTTDNNYYETQLFTVIEVEYYEQPPVEEPPIEEPPYEEPVDVGISAGGSHVSLLFNGKIQSWGRNDSKQLGNGTTVNNHLGTYVINGSNQLSGIVSISSKANRTLAVDNNGYVWEWGEGNNPDRIKGPGGVGYLSGVKQVSAGREFALALKNDGTVWAWGGNYGGQLGNGTQTTSSFPVQVKGPNGSGVLTNVISVSAGASHSLAVRSDNTVWGWGNNYYGQVGQYREIEDPWMIEPNYILYPSLITQGVVSVSAGDEFSVALKTDKTVLTWGYGGNGQLGDSSNVQIPREGYDYWTPDPVQVRIDDIPTKILGNVKEVSAGSNYALALIEDGTVVSWGKPPWLANTFTTMNTASLVAGPLGTQTLQGIVSVSAGDTFAVAMLDDGGVFGWGTNQYGQLGKSSSNGISETVLSLNSFRTPNKPRYVYDDNNRLKGIYFLQGGQKYLRTYGYDQNGNSTQVLNSLYQ